MNGAFLHLAINHIPVVGMPFAFLLLAAGLIRKSRDLTQAGFVTLIVMGLGAYPIVKTGGMAAHLIHDMPGVTHEMIHAHAHAADWGFRAAVILGILSLIGFIVSARSRTIPTVLAVIALLGSLGASVDMGYVAHLGGLIRHPELEEGMPTPPLPQGQVGAPAKDVMPGDDAAPRMKKN